MIGQPSSRIPFMRLVFFGAVAFALVMASLPEPPTIPGKPSDKLLHIIAFVVLTVLARLSYPDAKRWTILASLAVFGAFIEVVQAIPALHRDASVLDWLADCLAVAGTLAFMALARKIAGSKEPRLDHP